MMENHFDSWAETWIAKGEKRGEKRGVKLGEKRGELKGSKRTLLRLVRERYGDSAATEIAPTLDAIESPQTLDEIGVWIITGGSADDFFAKVRAL